MCDDEFDPLSQPVPSEDALDLAEDIARALGQPFDRAAVAAEAEALHETMFADLLASLGIDEGHVALRSGLFVRARAFAGRGPGGEGRIALDLVFDYWIFAAGFITMVLATTELSGPQVRRMHEALDDTFSLFIDNHRFEKLRERLPPLMRGHEAILHLSHTFSRGMTVAVLCHELAHIELGHLDRPASHEIEFEADARGTELFLQHVREGGRFGPSTVLVDPKLAGAPVILLRIFDLYEAWLRERGVHLAATAVHPPAAERADRVEAILRPHLNEPALHLLDGLTATLVDMRPASKGVAAADPARGIREE